MKKMKTKRALKKRIVKITAAGEMHRHQAYTSHLAQNKTTKQKKQLSKKTLFSKPDNKRLKKLLPNK